MELINKTINCEKSLLHNFRISTRNTIIVVARVVDYVLRRPEQLFSVFGHVSDEYR